MSLRKIHSETKRKELKTILHAPQPSHEERLWLVGFLGYAGYSQKDIMFIIHKGNRWKDYDQNYTRYQVAAALGSRRNGKSEGNTPPKGVPSSPPRRAKTWVHAMIDTTKHKQHCSIGCGKCIDLKCIDALRYLNDNTMQNMQSRNRN